MSTDAIKNGAGAIFAWIDKHNWIITMGMIVMLAMGFGFKTPKQKFDELDEVNSRQDAALELAKATLIAEITAIKVQTTEQRKLLEDLVAIRCLEAIRGTAELRRNLLDAQIPCARIMRERGLQ